MRFPTPLSLLCRRHALFQVRIAQRVCIITSRPASSLSAIHHGLRQSQKSRPQGFKPSSLETQKPRRSSQSSPNKRDPNWTPPTFKIKRGKKDVTDTGPKAQTRSSRFNDPEKSFGKRSLVYQMKHGALKETAAKLQGRGRTAKPSSSRPSRNEPFTPDSFMEEFRAVGGKPAKSSGGKPTKSSGGSRAETRKDKTSSSRPSSNEPFTPESFMNQFHAGTENATKTSHTHDQKRNERTPSSRVSTRDRVTPDNVKKESDAQTRMDEKPSSSKPFSPNNVKKEFDDRTRIDEMSSSRRPPSNPLADSFKKDINIQSHTDKMPSSRRPPSDQFTPDKSMNGFHARADEATELAMSAPTARDETPTNRTELFNLNERREERYIPREREKFWVDDDAIRIPRATAASQFLYGRSVVSAALKDSRRKLYKLYIYSGTDRQNDDYDRVLENLAQRKGIRVQRVPNKNLRMMDKMSDGRPHNGYVLEASPLPQLPLKALGPLATDGPRFGVELAYQSREEAEINGTPESVSYMTHKDRKPLVLLLDGILDPGNLGAILRTAAFLGVNEIAITRAYSATLTPVALKASSGAAEVLTLFSVDSPIDFIQRSKENGWMVYAAVPMPSRIKNSHMTLDHIESYDPLSSHPTVLVIGSEGKGLDDRIRRGADHEVSIPSLARNSQTIVDSLNVSVATGILCAAFVKKHSSSMVAIEAVSPGAELW